MREPSLSSGARIALAIRVWRTYAEVRRAAWSRPLPAAVEVLKSRPRRRRPPTYSADRLSRAVERCLWPVWGAPRCLFSSLTLFRLLYVQGEGPELVIGLLDASPDHRAHAWVELAGLDVGPYPGQGEHRAIGRFH